MTVKYSEDHEWIKVEGDIATVGITQHAQDALGDVVFVELPEVGKTYAQKDTAGVVESVKAASDVYAPISGKIVEVNAALVDDPALINQSPTADGWFFRIAPSGALPEDLMDADAYARHVESAS